MTAANDPGVLYDKAPMYSMSPFNLEGTVLQRNACQGYPLDTYLISRDFVDVAIVDLVCDWILSLDDLVRDLKVRPRVRAQKTKSLLLPLDANGNASVSC